MNTRILPQSDPQYTVGKGLLQFVVVGQGSG
jgi:hypothetical protein